MKNTLKEKLKLYEGQPIRIYTDDRRCFTGIELEAEGDMVSAIDKCGRIYYFELCHIDAVELPQMKLAECPKFFDFANDKNGESFSGKYCDGCGRTGCCD